MRSRQELKQEVTTSLDRLPPTPHTLALDL